MKQIIFQGWNTMRFIRLVLGVVILVQAIAARDAVLGLLGLFFSGMALFNLGCCGSGGCEVNTTRNSQAKKDISYEEISK